VAFGPVSFGKLPHINDISIENQGFGLDGFQVAFQCFGSAAIGSQMNVRNDNYIYFSSVFCHLGAPGSENEAMVK
jgi:hypothetical protein